MQKIKILNKKNLIIIIGIIFVLFTFLAIFCFKNNKNIKFKNKNEVMCDTDRKTVMENLIDIYELSSDVISFEEENDKFIRYKFIDNNEVKYFYFYKNNCSMVIRDKVVNY